jgi:hypothetical protein
VDPVEDLEDQEAQEDPREVEVEDHLVVSQPPYLQPKPQPLQHIPQNQNPPETSPPPSKETEN